MDVRGGQPLGLAAIARGAVRPGQFVQAFQQRAGVGDVATDRGVGPLPVSVPVKSQVQLDQPGHLADGVPVEPQRLQPAGDQLRPDHLVMVEADPPCRLEAAGGRFPDVVQQGGQSQHEVRSGDRTLGAVLQRDRLLQDGEGVLVDVLVPVVLVDLQAQGRQLRQDPTRQAAVDQESEAGPGPGGQQQLLQLRPAAFGGDDVQPGGHLPHRRLHVLVDVETELGGEPGSSHHPQRIVTEGHLRRPGSAQPAVDQIGQTSVRVDEGEVRQRDRHRVDREVAAGQVPVQGVPEGDLGFAGGPVVDVRPVGGHLDDQVTPPGADRAECLADRPVGVTPGPEQDLGAVGMGVGGEVEVEPGPPEQRVPDRSPHEGEGVTGSDEAPGQVGDSWVESYQGLDEATTGVLHAVAVGSGHGPQACQIGPAAQARPSMVSHRWGGRE